MEVDLATLTIAEHEVPRLGVLPGNLFVATPPEGVFKRSHVTLLDDDVEIGVRACLVPQAGIYPPASVEPDPDTQVVHEVQEDFDVFSRHLSFD